jgi:hypothetical protein
VHGSTSSQSVRSLGAESAGIRAAVRFEASAALGPANGPHAVVSLLALIVAEARILILPFIASKVFQQIHHPVTCTSQDYDCSQRDNSRQNWVIPCELDCPEQEAHLFFIYLFIFFFQRQPLGHAVKNGISSGALMAV